MIAIEGTACNNKNFNEGHEVMLDIDFACSCRPTVIFPVRRLRPSISVAPRGGGRITTELFLATDVD